MSKPGPSSRIINTATVGETGGQEVTITSDGVPKAVLSPVAKHELRKVFTGTWDHLKKMPPWRGGPTAEEIIREDRDGRGW